MGQQALIGPVGLMKTAAAANAGALRLHHIGNA